MLHISIGKDESSASPQNILRSFISATPAQSRRAIERRFLHRLFGLAPVRAFLRLFWTCREVRVQLHYLVEALRVSDFRPCLVTIVLMWDGLAAGGVMVPRSCGCLCIACFRACGSSRPQAHSIYAFPRARASAGDEISGTVVELKRLRRVNTQRTRSRARRAQLELSSVARRATPGSARLENLRRSP